MTLQYNKVQELLKSRYGDGIFHTHVSMIHPKGKFQFGRKELEEFWDVYCKSVLISNREELDENKLICGVAEKPQHYLPVLVDIDLKVKDTEDTEFSDHLYSDTQVTRVIEIYQSVLREIVDQLCEKDLTCVVLEKPIYYLTSGESMFAKNGFHLHFPSIFLSKIDQEVHLIPRIQEKLRESCLFENLGYEDSSAVLDKGYCTNPWLLYGSRKSEDMDPYTVSYVVTAEGKKIPVEKAFRQYQLFDNNERLIDISKHIEEFLPRILSIIPYGRQTREIKHGLPTLKKQQLFQKTRHAKTKIKVSVEEALKTSAKLLPMLSDFRAEDRGEWMTVGWALYNISDGSEQGLDQWLEFSSRCDEKYDEASCIYEWEKMVKKDITLGTLHYYASIDNPEMYNEYKIERSKEHMHEALNGSHNDIAKMLFAEHGTNFVCASISNKLWYQFTDHHWEEIEEGVYLREKISSDIVQRFAEIGRKTLMDKYNSTDKIDDVKLSTQLKLVNKMISNLKSSPYKNNVMRECAEVFYDPRFKAKIDQNKYLIGFQNGVYDLKLCEFRAGRPEDFIHRRLPINYRTFNPEDDEVQSIEDFFLKIFPDKSVRTYFLDVYSDIFVGGNTWKKVFMWIGEEGDNGKTVTQSLVLEKMLGELNVTMNTQYFTGKKVSAGQANPDLARAAPPVRSLLCVEANKRERIQTGEYKKLSGNDPFWARDLFEKGKQTREVKPMFMFTWVGNKPCEFDDPDQATWNRTRVIPFESVFVRPGDPCPSTLDEQLRQKRFPMDLKFGEKIDSMVEPLAWYLLEWRKKVTTIIEPPKVLAATEAYRRRNDVYRQFIEECTKRDDKSSIHLDVLYSRFKDWHKEGIPGASVPVKNDMFEYMEKIWGSPSSGKTWKGYRIKTLQDDQEEEASEETSEGTTEEKKKNVRPPI